MGIFNSDFLGGFAGSLANSLDKEREANAEEKRAEKRARLLKDLDREYKDTIRIVQNDKGQWVEIRENGNGVQLGTPRLLSESEAKAKMAEQEMTDLKLKGSRAEVGIKEKDLESYDKDKSLERLAREEQIATSRDSRATNAVQRQAALAGLADRADNSKLPMARKVQQAVIGDLDELAKYGASYANRGLSVVDEAARLYPNDKAKAVAAAQRQLLRVLAQARAAAGRAKAKEKDDGGILGSSVPSSLDSK